MPAALIDEGVGFRLLLTQAKNGQAAPAVPVLAWNEKQELDGQTLHARLVDFSAERVPRHGSDGEADHSRIAFTFAIFADPDRLKDAGAYAPISAAGRILTALEERFLTGDGHELQIGHCRMEYSGPADDLPSIVEVTVSGTAMLNRSTGIGEQDYDAANDDSGV